MDGVIEALHIYDEHNAPILSHTYTGRPLSAAQLLPLYLDQQRQQQQQQQASSSSSSLSSPSVSASGGPASLRKQPASLVYISDTSPPTLVFTIVHAGLLFLLTTSSELEPLLALEFLHRVADALEEFLGSPLLAGKIEGSYEVVAQLLTEMCDAGTIGTTEPNALHDLVEVEGLVGKLLGSITLPSKAAAALSSAAAQATSSSSSLPNPLLASSMSSMSSSSMGQRNGSSAAAGGPALPWRRANVRHTSNEMYADVIESLSVTLAPSGRPLAAFAQGSIAFTAKVSGLPDILLTLTGPSGKHNLGRVLELPVFHPCVRLARWKERPGELSFVPPDGRFLLAAYEVDLMPFDAGGGDAFSATAASSNSSLRMPVNVEVKTNLGPVGADFEVRASINRTFAFGRPNGPSSSGSGGGGGGGGGVRGLGGPHAGSPGAPLLEDVRITVPLPADVRNLLEIRPTRGDAVYNPGERVLEWHIPAKDIANGLTSFGLRCTVVGQQRAGHLDLDGEDSENSDDDNISGGEGSGNRGGGQQSNDYGFAEYTYNEPYQDEDQNQDQEQNQATPLRQKEKKKKKKDKGTSTTKTKSTKTKKASKTAPSPLEVLPPVESPAEAAANRMIARNKILMPSSASVSFSVKGWLASGVRVESIVLDTKRSRGLGDGVRPFKGVKYLTVSKGGIELRC